MLADCQEATSTDRDSSQQQWYLAAKGRWALAMTTRTAQTGRHTYSLCFKCWWRQHHGCSRPYSRALLGWKTSLGIAPDNLVWPCSCPCLEQDSGLETSQGWIFPTWKILWQDGDSISHIHSFLVGTVPWKNERILVNLYSCHRRIAIAFLSSDLHS